MTTTDLTIYSRSVGCGACIATDRGVKGHGLDRLTGSISKHHVDLEEDKAQEARELATELGLELQSPLVIVHRAGEFLDQWTGYRPDKLRALAGRLAAEQTPAAEFVEAAL